MKTNSQFSPQCPPVEKLSEWHDEKVDRAVGRHLEECVPCRKVVGDYCLIDRTVRRRTAAAAPADLAARISAKCRELPPPTALQQFWWAPAAWRAAAALAVLLGIWGAVFYHQRELVSGSSVPTLAASQPAAAVPAPVAIPPPPPPPAAVADSAPARTLSPAAAMAAANVPPVTALRPGDLSLATAAAGRGPALKQGVPVRQVNAVVHHIWLVDDPRAQIDAILKLLPANLAKAEVDSANQSMTVSLPDNLLQMLVDNLGASGAALVSPEYPQPGESAQTRFSGRRVVYYADILPRAWGETGR